MRTEPILEAAGIAGVWDGYKFTSLHFHGTSPGGIRDQIMETLEEHQCEDTGHGYMEFFDWWAGCTAHELTATAKEYSVMMADGSEPHPASYEALMPVDQEIFAKRIWAAM